MAVADAVLAPAPAPTVNAQNRLWHCCRKHPFEGDAPCGPGCVAFCGRCWRPSDRDVLERDVPARDICIVCDVESDRILGLA